MARRSGWDDDYDQPTPRGGRRGNRSRMSGSEVTMALEEAQALQNAGHLDDALSICEELLDNGVERPDLRYFAGWMYQETSRWDQAAEQFSTLLDDPEYALSCFYALGQCSRAMGNLHEAAQYFDEAVDRVRLDALQQDDADQLMQLCLEAAEVHREAGDMAGAETILSALSRFVSSQGWTTQMRDVEQMQRDVLGSAPNQQQRRRRPANPSRSAIPQRNAGNRSGLGPTNAARGMPSGSPPMGGGYNAVVGGTGYQHVPGVPSGDDRLGQIIDNLSGGTAQARASAQQLPEPLRTQVARTIDDIVNYVAHGLLTPAIEECLRVMELAPQFLDIHLLLAEIYARQGKTEQAVAKYAVLIDQYQTIGRMDDVVRAYRRILQLDPNNLNYRAKLIDTLVRLGRGEEALDERIAAADSYLRLGYAERAIQEYEQALLTFPNNMQVRLGYAGALLRGGRPQHAVTELQRVLQVEPNNPRALVRLQIAVASGATTSFGSSMPGAQTSQARAAAMELLTRALRTLRMERFASYSEVVQDYLQSIELNPTNGDLRFALGQVHLAAGRAQEAQTAFQQTAQLPGMEVLGRFALAQVLVGRGDVNSATAAVQDLEDALAWTRRAAPDPAVWAARPRTDGEDRQSPEVEISTLLSRAYQISGQVARGQSMAAAANAQRTQQSEVYAAIAEIGARHANPVDSLNDYHQLARHYRENRQVENAVAVLREMARVAPEEPGIRSEIADLQRDRGLLDESLAELRNLVEIHVRRGQMGDAALVCDRMATICWGMGHQQDAMGILRQGMDYSPDNMDLRQEYVQYCLEMGPQFVPAAIEQQTVVARFFFRTRQTREAVAALQQLIAMDKASTEAYDMLGQTYYSVGEYEQATRVYRNLARQDPTNAVARARLTELQGQRPVQ